MGKGKETTGREAFVGQLTELPDDVKEPLLEFDLALRDVEQQVGALTEHDWSTLTEGLSPLETARLNVTSAYALNTLFFIYLKTQGVMTSEHPVKQELERVRTYLQKAKSASGQADEHKAQSRLNTDAAKRFIAHALSGEPAKAGEGGAAGSASGSKGDRKSKAADTPGGHSKKAKKK
jgi:exosome complex protein LRP1